MQVTDIAYDTQPGIVILIQAGIRVITGGTVPGTVWGTVCAAVYAMVFG
jgi:hypothetical protein